MSNIDKMRAALEIYADPANWELRRQVLGHGDSMDIITWKGPKQDWVYAGPSKGPEYAREALSDESK